MIAAPGIGAWAAGGSFAWGASIATLSGIGLATAIGVSLVAASIAGSALTPDIGDIAGTDAYAGMKLQTQKNNISPVPVIYGKHKIAGNIIFETTNSIVNTDSSTNGYNRDYWALIVFSSHGWTSGHGIYAGGDTLSIVGGIIQTHTNLYVHTKWFSIASDTNIQTLNFVKNEAGDYITGSSLGFASIVIPAGSYGLTVHQVYDGEENKNTQLKGITQLISGKAIRRFDDDSATPPVYSISAATSYSTNPVEIILDLLGDALNIPDADIDVDSFGQAKTICADNGWNCHIALIQQANIQSIIQDVLATCRGQIVHSENKWKLKIDTKQQSVVKTLTDDDFINNTLNISMKGNRDIANKIIFKYINPDDEWLSAQVVKEDTDLQTSDGQTLEKTLDVKGVTDTTQANELAEIALNTMRYTENAAGVRIKQTPLALSFATTVKNADLEVGDVITINSDLLDRNRNFIILSVETDQSGLIQIVTREYAETHFKNSSGTYLI
jgi:hypothetical protein